MARIRTIKPEFWTDERIVQLPFQARLLFIGIWNFCDDQGCITDSPEKIRLQVLPADREVDVDDCLDLLVACGLLEQLINAEGLRAFHVVNWAKHQKIDNPAKPKILDGSYKKLAIPSEARRGIAKSYGCPPGESVSAECYFCGAPGLIHWNRLSSGRPSAWVSFSGLEIDHLLPESKGGETTSKNLVLSCRSCNRGRNNKDYIDYLFGKKCDEKPALAIPSEPSPQEGKGKEGKGLKAAAAREEPLESDQEYLDRITATETTDTRRMVVMTPGWKPDPKFPEQAKASGVDPAALTDDALVKFRIFYDGQERLANRWNLALIDWLKRERPANVADIRAAAKPAPVEKKTEYWRPDPKRMMTESELATLHAGRALLK